MYVFVFVCADHHIRPGAAPGFFLPQSFQHPGPACCGCLAHLIPSGVGVSICVSCLSVSFPVCLCLSNSLVGLVVKASAS